MYRHVLICVIHQIKLNDMFVYDILQLDLCEADVLHEQFLVRNTNLSSPELCRAGNPKITCSSRNRQENVISDYMTQYFSILFYFIRFFDVFSIFLTYSSSHCTTSCMKANPKDYGEIIYSMLFHFPTFSCWLWEQARWLIECVTICNLIMQWSPYFDDMFLSVFSVHKKSGLLFQLMFQLCMYASLFLCSIFFFGCEFDHFACSKCIVNDSKRLRARGKYNEYSEKKMQGKYSKIGCHFR